MKKIVLCSLITLSVFAAEGPVVGKFIDRAPETKELTIKVDDKPLSFDPAILNECGAFRSMCHSFGHEYHKVIPEEVLQSIVQHHVLKGLAYDQAKEFVDILNLENADEVHKYLAQYTIDLEDKDEERKKQAQKILLALYQKADHMNVPLLQKVCKKLIAKTDINVNHLPFQLSLPIMQSKINKALLGHLGYQQTVFNCGSSVSSAVFSPDGKRIVLTSDFKNACIWDVGIGACLYTLEGHNGWVKSAVFSPDSKRIVSVSLDDNVCIWDAGTGACLYTLEGHIDWISSVAFSPDGECIVLVSLDDNIVRIWDAGTGACLHTLEGHTDWIRSVAFSQNGKRIASASRDKTVRIWDIQTGIGLFTLEGHTDWVNSVAFSPDGKRVASASRDKTVRIWDIQTGIDLFTLKGHTNWVNSVVFSPNGKCIASASLDNTLRIWDAKNGDCQFTLQGHTKWLSTVTFSPNGKCIVSTSDGSIMCIWKDYNCLLKKCPLEIIELFDKARISWQKRKPHQITADEKKTIFKYNCYGRYVYDQHPIVKMLKDERLFTKYSEQRCCLQ